MKAFLMVMLCLALFIRPARADVVIDWNNVLIEALMADATQANPTFGSRAMAIVHAAIYDAVNAIIPERQPYALSPFYRAPAGASPEAAASEAAYLTLAYLFPEQRARFQAARDQQLAQVPEARPRLLGIQVGMAAANAIICQRKNDGAYRVVPFTPGTRPGQWRPTPADFTPALWPQWPYVRPFILKYGAQFRPGPPPALWSQQYTDAFYEVRRLGEYNSPFRTEDQTRIAYFWSYDVPPAEPPPALYNEMVQVIATDQGNTFVENAYLFAILNLTMADGAIACWDSKYTFKFWRPITGIRLAANDYNPLTFPDPNWWPLGPPEDPKTSPGFPSYASGHATFGGATFRMLQLFYGTDAIAFTFESGDLPGQPRTFTRLSQADNENADSRIYIGAHWRFDQTVGQRMGHQVAEYAFSHALLPRPH